MPICWMYIIATSSLMTSRSLDALYPDQTIINYLNVHPSQGALSPAA